MNPEVSIIIPTYNHLEDCLKPCIESIIQHTDLSRVEIIVVCNGCTDGTHAYIRELQQKYYFVFTFLEFEQPLGYTKATNEGILRAKGKYVVLFNNDNVLLGQRRHEWLEQLEKPFIDNPKMSVTAPSKIFCHSSKYHFIIFYCAMIPRVLFDELGLLDEAFSPGGCEDIDWAIRCQQKGYQIAKVGAEESELWDYSTFFPIWHKAEQTVHGVKDWESLFQRNNDILKAKYKKPSKYSVIIYANQDDNIQPCVRSIFLNTDYFETEVSLVIQNGRNNEYIKKVAKYGPYKNYYSDDKVSVSTLAPVAKDHASEYTIFLDGRATLLGRDNKWIEKLIKPFYRANTGATSPVTLNGRVSQFCCAFRTADLRSYPGVTNAISDLNGVVVENGVFPIYFPHLVT